MIIFKNLSWQTRSDKPFEDWTNSAKYVVNDNSDLANKIINSCPYGFTPVEDKDGNLIDVSPKAEPLETTIKNKISQLDKVCTETIYTGTDIQLSDGNVYHFTLDMQDQANLTGVALQLGAGEPEVSWHTSDITQPCVLYSSANAQKIINTLTLYKSYHITYFRDLRIYVLSLTSLEDINNIEYGYILPESAKSDVLKSYEVMMSGGKNN